jgi:hypothetical protein
MQNILYIYNDIPKETSDMFVFVKNNHTIQRSYVQMVREYKLRHSTVYDSAFTRAPLVEAVLDTQTNITLFIIEEGAPGFLI